MAKCLYNIEIQLRNKIASNRFKYRVFTLRTYQISFTLRTSVYSKNVHAYHVAAGKLGRRRGRNDIYGAIYCREDDYAK